MSSPLASEQAANPTALADTLRRLRASWLRHLLVVGAICFGIAVLLTTLDGGAFRYKLLYSVCIGAICMSIVDLVRIATAWGTDLWRQRRGVAMSDSQAVSGWRGVIPGSLLSMVIGPPLGVALADAITGFSTPSLLQFGSSSTRVILLLSVLATVISVLVLSTLERLQSSRAEAEAARRLAAENQLRLLQSQLEPHMLFNTLANLRVLIGLDPPQAQAMLDRLIAFLRATLNASRSAAHPLATEFERIADYLALMGTRMGPRLQVQLDLPAALQAVPVPPLLLQPLVENAIKHGLEPHVQGGVLTVRACAEGPMLVLSVADTGTGLAATPAAGGTHFGLAQVRERLATLHGGAAALTLEPAPGGGTLATVRLPLPQASPP